MICSADKFEEFEAFQLCQKNSVCDNTLLLKSDVGLKGSDISGYC